MASQQFAQVAARAQDWAKDNPRGSIVVGVVGGISIAAALTQYYRKNIRRDGSEWNSTVAGATRLLNNADSVLDASQVNKSVTQYTDLYQGAREGATTDAKSIEQRRQAYQTIVTNFYDMVTDFYTYGWGDCFHFAPRWMGEGFWESIKRAEYHLCSRLGMKPGTKALDVGCGVGGPMRNMAIFSGADITGVTLSEYQVRAGNKYNAAVGLADRARLVQGDFQVLDNLTNDSFDVAYAIEATCHSPNRVQCFSTVGRKLKKGGLFALYDWVVLTGRYDPNNARHVRIREGIEVGNGLPVLAYPEEVVRNLEDAGFTVLDHYDANKDAHSPHQVPWYAPLGVNTLANFRTCPMGRRCTHALVFFLELFRIAPKGTLQISKILNDTADDLVDSGKLGIFTPSYFLLARKN